MPPRSYLYVPADRPDRIAGAFGRGADALILDLEDAVAADSKQAALDYLVSWLPRAQAPVWIRVNAGERGLADVRTLAGLPNVAGFCLPKASVAQVTAAARALEGSAAQLAPLLEDAAAVLDARAIAALPRVVRLQIGEADLRAQLGLRPGLDERELLAIRSQVVLVSAAAQIGPPLGPVSVNFTNLDAFAESTRALRRLGFAGRACIHPAQVAIVNAEFTATPEEAARARSVLSALAASGGAATRMPDGEMVDEATARAARQALDDTGPAR